MTKFAKFIVMFGLFVIPFVFWPGTEQFRAPKEAVALSLAFFVFLLMVWSGGFERMRNPWPLAFVGWSLLCAYFSPKFWQIRTAVFTTPQEFHIVSGVDAPNFWMWKILVQLIIFFGLLWSVSSLHFRKREIKALFFMCALSGCLMSIYVFFQWAGIDPVFMVDRRNHDISGLSRPGLGGLIGQSTLVAPFIAMTIPFCLYLRRYVWSVLCLVALILTDSQVAQLAALVSATIGLWMLCRSNIHRSGLIVCAAIVCALVFCYAEDHPSFRSENGRYAVWKTAVSDMRSMPLEQFGDHRHFAVQGFGPGTFEAFNFILKNSRWMELHNEPLETAFNFGLIGFWLVLMVAARLARDLMKNWAGLPNRPEIITLLVSLVYISLAGLGTFPWHIEPMRFYSVVILGLLLNRRLIEEKLI